MTAESQGGLDSGHINTLYQDAQAFFRALESGALGVYEDPALQVERGTHMTTKLQEALAAFRELAQERHRLECEIVETKARLEELETAQAHGRVALRKAQHHIMALASGMPCEVAGCSDLPAYTQIRDERGCYRCEAHAVEAGWVLN